MFYIPCKKGGPFIWVPLILIFMKLDMDVNGLGTIITEIAIFGTLGWIFNNVERYNEDTYGCPTYCEVDHKHKFLDLQSDFDKLLAENAKDNKNRDLALK